MSQAATYQRTATLPLADLRPFPGNAKRGNVPVILESLCRTGQYRGLVVRAHEDRHTVLAGNHTLQAIAAHGPGDCGLTVKAEGQERPCGLCGNQPWEPVVRCEIVTCTDDTATRINLVDNRSSEGEYDSEALAALLGGLDDDLTGTGWSDTDLDDLLATVEEAAAEEAALIEEATTPPTPAPKPAPAAPVPAPTPTDAPPPDDDGHIPLTLTCTPPVHEETTRLIVAARNAAYTGADAPTVTLHALRTLWAVLAHQDDPTGTVPVAGLLAAAGLAP